MARQPADHVLLEFRETELFVNSWDALRLDVERDLWELQEVIMRRPAAGDVISGGGGARKLRFAPSRWAKGKSGAIRVIYAYFQRFGIVILFYVYEKAERESLDADDKKAIAKALKRIDDAITKRRSLRG